jgi:hypothetical protein
MMEVFAYTIAPESHYIICHYMAIAVEILDYRRRTTNSDLWVIADECPLGGGDNS